MLNLWIEQLQDFRSLLLWCCLPIRARMSCKVWQVYIKPPPTGWTVLSFQNISRTRRLLAHRSVSSSSSFLSLSCRTPLSPRYNHPLSLMTEASFSRVFPQRFPAVNSISHTVRFPCSSPRFGGAEILRRQQRIRLHLRGKRLRRSAVTTKP